MKVYYRPTPKLTIELDVADQKTFFEELAKVQEIVAHTCGKCSAGTEDLVYQVREVDENLYYEIRCTKCSATLTFGMHKVGGSIYPKRYLTDNKGKPLLDEDGKKQWIPNNGWAVWDAKARKRV